MVGKPNELGHEVALGFPEVFGGGTRRTAQRVGNLNPIADAARIIP